MFGHLVQIVKEAGGWFVAQAVCVCLYVCVCADVGVLQYWGIWVVRVVVALVAFYCLFCIVERCEKKRIEFTETRRPCVPVFHTSLFSHHCFPRNMDSTPAAGSPAKVSICAAIECLFSEVAKAMCSGKACCSHFLGPNV